jgi:hypothetical protein
MYERMHQLWLNVGVIIVSGITGLLRSVTGFPNILPHMNLCIYGLFKEAVNNSDNVEVVVA